MSYETFDHTADIGLRVRASDLNSLFAEAGRGLFSLIVSDYERLDWSFELDLRLDGTDLEMLFLDWLNELLYLFECHQCLLSQFDVRVTDTGLTAKVRGEKMDPQRHQLDHEVKAITYHDLKVKQTDAGWLAEVIVDI